MSTSKPRCSKNQVRWQYAGIASDHGKRRSSCSSVGVSPSFGSSCKRNSRYPNGSSPLRLAVSIILKHNALASAPLAVSQNRKFFRDITKGFTVRSAILFVRVRRPSMRTLSYACRWFKEYVPAFGVFVLFNYVYIPFRRSQSPLHPHTSGRCRGRGLPPSRAQAARCRTHGREYGRYHPELLPQP